MLVYTEGECKLLIKSSQRESFNDFKGYLLMTSTKEREELQLALTIQKRCPQCHESVIYKCLNLQVGGSEHIQSSRKGAMTGMEWYQDGVGERKGKRK